MYVCMIAKQYRHSCKCNKIKPHFQDLIRKIKEIENIEYHIAHKNNKIVQHQGKWGGLSGKLKDSLLDPELILAVDPSEVIFI